MIRPIAGDIDGALLQKWDPLLSRRRTVVFGPGSPGEVPGKAIMDRTLAGAHVLQVLGHRGSGGSMIIWINGAFGAEKATAA